MSGEIAPNPFRDDITESTIRRNIDAVDYQKAREGITWTEYVGDFIEKTGRVAVSSFLAEKLEVIEEWLPEISYAEALSDTGRNQDKFNELKFVVAREINDATTVLREEMMASWQSK